MFSIFGVRLAQHDRAKIIAAGQHNRGCQVSSAIVFSSALFSRLNCFLVSIVFSSPLFFVSIGFHCNIFSRQIQFWFCMFTWRSRHRMQRLQLMQRNVAARPHAQSTDRCDNAIQCVCCVVRVNMQKCADTLWYASSARL